MKRSFLAVLIVAFALVAQTASAAPVSFDFAVLPDASIRFDGTTKQIDFPNSTTFDFTITQPGGALDQLRGNIGGQFTVGAVSTPFPAVPYQTASVTTANGQFSVYDGVNTLTASLDLKDVSVFFGMFGALNAVGQANLTGISYSGSNSDLVAIANGSEQTVVMTFQFPPSKAKTLTQLMATGQLNSTSYSGSMSAVPEPSALVLLSGAAIGLVAFVRRRKTA